MGFSSFLKSLIIIYSLFALMRPNSHAQPTFQPVPHFRIVLNLKLPNIISYDLTITNLHRGQTYYFRLNKGLKIRSLIKDALLENQELSKSGDYEYRNDQDGVAHFQVSGQLINEDAIGSNMMLLNSSSDWFPNLADLMSYDLSIRMEDQNKSYSPSNFEEKCGINCNRFIETRPQEDIYIVFGKLFEYRKDISSKTIGVLLLNQDDELAERYLNILPEFIERYEHRLGSYPYSAFYVVENFNETGLGMPGFTLLGQTVLRLPFILRTSLPHEVLHNWWGNSVFVDFKRGNWCEGLTTYGADHFEQELTGKAPQYRRDTLVGYEDFVKADRDFPLREFKDRHNEASQAIGYGKGMMLYHMMHKWVGNEKFFDGLRVIANDFQFSRIGFDEFGSVFGKITSNIETERFFTTWVNSLGAVDITAEQKCSIDGNPEVLIQSIPSSLNYSLPFNIESELHNESGEIKVTNGNQKIILPYDFVGKVTLDPNFDVFRKLRKGEKPLTLSGFLSKEKIYVLTGPGLENEAKNWFKGLSTTFKGIVHWIKSIDEAEPDSYLIFYGFKDLTIADQILPYFGNKKITLNDGNFEVNNQIFPAANRGWLLMAFNKMRNQTLIWASKPNEVLPENWGKQLLHYSKFGILFFEGKTNLLKTSWAEESDGLPIQISGCKK